MTGNSNTAGRQAALDLAAGPVAEAAQRGERLATDGARVTLDEHETVRTMPVADI